MAQCIWRFGKDKTHDAIKQPTLSTRLFILISQNLPKQLHKLQGIAENVDKRLDIVLNDWLKLEWKKQLVLEDLRGDAKVETKDAS